MPRMRAAVLPLLITLALPPGRAVAGSPTSPSGRNGLRFLLGLQGYIGQANQLFGDAGGHTWPRMPSAPR